MLPRLQPPRGRAPPQKLKLNTQLTATPAQSQFKADVIASMSQPAAAPAAAPASSEATAREAAAQEAAIEDENENAAVPDVSRLVVQSPAPPARDADSGMSALDWYTAWANGEIEEVRDLGEGSGGAVRMCRLRHDPRRPYARAAAAIGTLAIKEIPANPDPELRKQILRELQFNRSCESPYIVNYFGAFLVEEVGQIYIAMEFCDGGSLHSVLRRVRAKNARISERAIAYIAASVLEGITYLYSRKIIHRDIKPQNILLTSQGAVKLCDFGVSGEVVDSLVTTFTGTSYYMAPERIRGQPYTVTSDVWSLGITLMELAMNRFPFDTSTWLTPIELLTQIVNSPSPQLPDEPGIKWSASFHHFLAQCLEKDSSKRPPPQKLLSHPWIRGHRAKKFDMQRFVKETWE